MLQEILAPLGIDCSSLSNNINIEGITSNLQHASSTDLAFYRILPGKEAEEKYIQRISSARCGLLIINRPPPMPIFNNTLVISDNYFLPVQKKLADILYPFPAQLKLVGVTGTNGKTTTVNLAAQIAGQLGKKAISIGTLGIKNQKNEILVETLDSTMPSFIELRRLLFTYAKNAEVAFMEISSHGLDQNRLYDLKLAVAAWTNLTQDHLDYHHDMETYFKAKAKIATTSLVENGICFFSEGEEMLCAKVAASSNRAVMAARMDWGNLEKLPLFFRSLFNRKNLQLALQLNGFIFEKNKKAITPSQINLEKITPPEGRLNIIPFKDNYIVIDYAHTPDALENIALALSRDFSEKKLAIIFGCGGNRDRKKRPLMGAIAKQYASRVVVTSDNPRDEVPEAIIQEILAGISDLHSVTVEADRSKAIKMVMATASNEVILIAGKGHETYQEIKGVKYPFSDYSEVEKWKS
ncbi:MAG TPA: UDP-N-acetylmuramoyl-L-alanyl-D-glutamate--2,6-diaminopimelate ligase [Bacteriovoracaceae bacterium]|nr:UDP-N-acetylmuramoyl-L-alanyl-D-glutamate--2,6-diaminopimelate ligase [Bacteriovoracaceae bacterium]